MKDKNTEINHSIKTQRQHVKIQSQVLCNKETQKGIQTKYGSKIERQEYNKLLQHYYNITGCINTEPRKKRYHQILEVQQSTLCYNLNPYKFKQICNKET